MGRRIGLLVSAAREAAPWLGLIAFVLIPASQIFVALEALWMRNLIDGAIRADLNAAIIAAGLLGASRGFEAFLLVPASYVQMTFGERMSIAVNRRIAKLIATAPGLELHEDHETQDRLALLRDPAGFSSIVFRLAGGIGTILGFLATIALLVSVHPILAVTPLLVVPGILANRRGNKVTRAAQEAAAVHDRLSRHYSSLATRPMWNKEVRVFGVAGRVRRRQREEAMAARDVRAAAATRAALGRMVASAVTNVGLAAALIFVASLAARGLRTPGALVLSVLLLTRLSRVVEELHDLIGASQEHIRTIDRFVWLEDRVREHLASFGQAEGQPPDEIRAGIRFAGVSFCYDGTDNDVLKDLDLTIPAGSVVAIVGDNGAGKTTLVKLLSRFYQPTKGRILVDDVDIATVDAAAWRERLTGGFQDFARLELRARESVGVSVLDAIPDDARIEAAIGQAGGVGTALVDGLDTQLGPTWPGGIDLSMGQWQRIALARGWLRHDALVTILDEPTASLDAETEHDLYLRARDRAWEGKSRGEITILISHRFTTVAMADLIAVLEDGRISELGSHDEVMARDGTYAELYRLHAAGYA